MTLGERIANVDELRSWKDQIPFHYEYTAGVAGEKFLRGLKEGKILGAKCGNCGKTYLPPKTYCVDCYLEITSFPNVGVKGRVAALTGSLVDFEGKRTKKARTFVFVTFDGVTGGLIHHGVGSGLRIGGTVRPAFKAPSKRTGTLMDIEGFVSD
jgi:uncharacterized protein